MANQAKITVRVMHNRASTTISMSTTGRYFGLGTGAFQRTISGLPIQSTASAAIFWEGILALVQANLESDPTPP